MSGPARTPQHLSLGSFAEALRARRSVNLFEPGPIDKEAVLEAIELARWAPNHRLTEPWRFYLIGPETADAVRAFGARFEAETKGERAAAARLQRLKGVPGFLVLTCRSSGDDLQEREDYAACCCAAQNLMLYLWQRGIGTKWTTGAMTRDPRFYEILGIDPTQEFVVGFFWFGLPRAVGPQKRKEVAEIVTELP